MTFSNSSRIGLILFAFAIGCEKSTVDEPTPSPPENEIDANRSQPGDERPGLNDVGFSNLFKKYVAGNQPNSSPQQLGDVIRAIDQIDKFSENDHREFLVFLRPKLEDRDPQVRMNAAYLISYSRIYGLGTGQENEDLILVFVKLLREEDPEVRRLALFSLEMLVEDSGLEAELTPLVEPLVQNLGHSRTVYWAIKLLGEIGPWANDAITPIRETAARMDDEVIDRKSSEAIDKIEGR